MAKNTFSLDFSTVRDLERPRAFRFIPEETAKPLERFAETAARAEAATKFSWWLASASDTLHTQEDKALSIREAFLRAGLSEFVSIEEALARDIEAKGLRATPFGIFDSTNPLLHCMKALRHLNVHLASSQLTSDTRPAIWVYEEKEHHFEYRLWLVPDFDANRFRSLRVSRNYCPADVDRLVAWFQAEQREWGVDHLLFLAVCHYAAAIVSRYRLAA